MSCGWELSCDGLCLGSLLVRLADAAGVAWSGRAADGGLSGTALGPVSQRRNLTVHELGQRLCMRHGFQNLLGLLGPIAPEQRKRVRVEVHFPGAVLALEFVNFATIA